MDATTMDWVVVGCSAVSTCASLSAPIVGNFLGKLRHIVDNGWTARKESYAAILNLVARADERFMSASMRQKLMRSRPEQTELSVQVDEDLSAGWVALEELSRRLQADQLICSEKVLALVSDVNSKYFWSAESIFRQYGNIALDLDDLHQHSQEFLAKLKQRCRREIGIGRQR